LYRGSRMCHASYVTLHFVTFDIRILCCARFHDSRIGQNEVAVSVEMLQIKIGQNKINAPGKSKIDIRQQNWYSLRLYTERDGQAEYA